MTEPQYDMDDMGKAAIYDSLRAEIERLRRENAHLIHQARVIDEQHRAEIERLRADLAAERERCARIVRNHSWPAKVNENTVPIEMAIIEDAIRKGEL